MKTPYGTVFWQYVLAARIPSSRNLCGGDPVTDLIGDMRRDKDLKTRRVAGIVDLKNYLCSRGACVEAIAAVTPLWKRYHHWLGSEKGRAVALAVARRDMELI